MEHIDYIIPDVSEFVVNAMFMRTQNGGQHIPFSFYLSVLDEEYKEIINVDIPFDMDGKPDRDDADFLLGALGYHVVNSIFLSEPNAITRGFCFATMTLNPDLVQAERWSAFFQEGVDQHKMPTIGMVATNGTDWSDISTGRTGSIPFGFTTAFEQQNTFGEPTFAQEDFELVEVRDDEL